MSNSQVEQIAERVLNAAGSSLKHYEKRTREAILGAIPEELATNHIEPMQFRNLMAIMLNIDLDELEDAGVIEKGMAKDGGGTSWARYNDDPLMFVMKLGDKRLEALTAIINKRVR